MFTVLCRRLSVFLWRCSSVPFRLISSCLYLSAVLFLRLSRFRFALLDRVLDAVLQWRFSSFPVVDLYLLLFSFVSALPAKIASCKNVMKCDVRITAHAPASHSACHDHKKLPAYLLVWVWGSTFAAFGRKGVPLQIPRGRSETRNFTCH